MVKEESYSVGLVIPTLNAESLIGHLLETICAQTIQPREIIVIDSSSDDRTVKISKEAGATVIVIPRSEFDHGGTRHTAFLQTTTDFVLFLTQDALPANDEYIEQILKPFDDEKVAMVTGRQIPRTDARSYEKLVRQFNYPDRSFVRDISDLSRLGIKTFFASDVCSAYRSKQYLASGGFPSTCNTNEDMLMAAKFIHDGYKIAYESRASVIHSHNLSFKQQFRRNKEIGFFLEQHKGDLMGASEYGEGKRLVLSVAKQLLTQGDVGGLAGFFSDCVARILGNRMGKRAGRESLR